MVALFFSTEIISINGIKINNYLRITLFFSIHVIKVKKHLSDLILSTLIISINGLK